MPDSVDLSITPYFGGFILETLTIGMYGESRNAIREYIQNGFDSIQRAVEEKVIKPGEGLIEIELASDYKSLTIRDNGVGLSAKNAANVLTRVGASGKSYRKNAGFRGIGRLAGIVFSDKVVFVTKARGEAEETTVIFDGKAMRSAMAPARGSERSAEQLLRDTVRASKGPAKQTQEHFFEVRLEGLVNPPNECRSFHEMYDFVSQVAPVPYRGDFPYAEKIRAAGREYGLAVEEVSLKIRDGGGEPQPVFKQYGPKYKFESGEVSLSDVSIHASPTRRWWIWVGHKTESGAYTDDKVRGLRVRVRNIQIDGADLFRAVFSAYAAKSHIRFQDYYLGEIFVDPAVLVPNARRDGFEEDANWQRVRAELGGVAKRLGKDAYAVSNAGQLSVEAQKKNLADAKRELRALERTGFANGDRVVKLSSDITKYQQRIAKASKDADLDVLAEFQAIGSEFSDIKRTAMSHITVGLPPIDREAVQQEARDETAREIMQLLEDGLSPQCVAEVRTILAPYLGDEAL